MRFWLAWMVNVCASLQDWKPKEGEVMADAFIKEMMVSSSAPQFM